MGYEIRDMRYEIEECFCEGHDLFQRLLQYQLICTNLGVARIYFPLGKGGLRGM